ncbi:MULTISPECIES: HU family DNA-binding protein [unclassified Endozoicomonas]|uniref:HU family DNA-binding protein n=1 Tax=unclassified Endozoicomonas TaxID=2644528 RepID=UPI002147CBE6|nr:MULTISPECIES: HU family DNA-binding protein [unclassified Endozoicomonas]
MAAKKAAAIKDKYSKTQILAEISESTGLSRKEVGAVLDELGILVERHIKKRGCGEFTLPGLLKIVTRKKPAQKAKKGVPNPFKPGELMDVPAKPASIQVKVRPLKKLKEYAAS